jgi:alkylated DNA repair dioxygenase AlkB
MTAQQTLFDLPVALSPKLPPGFRYHPDLVTARDERELAGRFEALPFKPFEFQGYLGNRRVVSYGWRYDFARQTLEKAEALPAFLSPLRMAVAAFTGHDPEAFQQALVLEYTPGAGIGWHCDRPQFQDVAGVSLMAPCTFRLRRKIGTKWERASLIAAPRSAYLMTGPARTDWEHSIPAVDALRYSVTFRSFRG